MREIQIEARPKKDQKREAVRFGRRCRYEAGALSWARNISASCITVSARKFCQSLGHAVRILEVIL